MSAVQQRSSHILRVKTEHEKSLQSCLQKIEQWEKFKDDYVELQDRLKTFPDKLSYDVMVPFGSHAFMPGTVVHTNEVTVLLGDNWFTKVSAKKASEIAGRRVKQCDNMLCELDKEKTQYRNWLGFIADLANEDLVDIREEYDPERERLWNEQHSKNLKEYRRRIANAIKQDEESAEKLKQEKEIAQKLKQEQEEEKRESNDYYFNRLNELEEQEDEDKEDSLSSEEDEEGESEEAEEAENDEAEEDESKETEEAVCSPLIKENGTSELTAMGTVPVPQNKEDKEIDSNLKERHVRWIDMSRSKCSKITFNHSTFQSLPSRKKNRRRRNSRSSSTSEVEEEENTVKSINSPSDVYKRFVVHSKPKSILKTINSQATTGSPSSSLESVSSEESHLMRKEFHRDSSKESIDMSKKGEVMIDIEKGRENTSPKSEQAFTGEIYERSSKENFVPEAKAETRKKSLFKQSRHKR